MRYLTGTVAWIYDFLAEDIVLVTGLAIGIVAAAVADRISPVASAAVLCVSIVATIATSVIRTARAEDNVQERDSKDG